MAGRKGQKQATNGSCDTARACSHTRGDGGATRLGSHPWVLFGVPHIATRTAKTATTALTASAATTATTDLTASNTTTASSQVGTKQ